MWDKLFNMESPWMRFLVKCADLLWLNILTIILCIPVITAGAALTALHRTCLKMVRNTDGSITKEYFAFFKDRFLQTTGLWIVMVLITLILAWNYYVMASNDGFSSAMKILTYILTAVMILIGVWVIPMQARFINPIKSTLMNSAWAMLIKFPVTLLMVGITIFPVLCYIVSITLTPIVLMWGISAPVYLKAVVYNDFFEEMEDRIRSAQN